MSVAAIILAAGFSRRLGRPKQTEQIGGETLLDRSTRIAVEAGLWPVFLVVNPALLPSSSPGRAAVRLVPNPAPEEGLAASIRCGITAALEHPETTGAIIMTCDQIAVRPEHLRSLAATPDRILGSRYGGRTGVPAYFPRAAFPALLTLRGDIGARDLLKTAAAIETEDLAFDIDTEEDLAFARQRFGSAGRS